MLSKTRSVFRGFFFPFWSIPIALLVLTLLSYGLRALSLGFFWDDWPYLWFFHRFGPEGILTAFSGDRPFLSFIYTVSLSLLGNSIQGWQVFGLLARWLCGLGLWWALSQTWPRHSDKAAWAAVLFTVYPGFTQQWISVIYGQAFFLFAALFFSIGLTIWLAQRRRTLNRVWIAVGTILALALSAFTMFSTEYFFGLELLRPVLLWLVLTNNPNRPFEPGKTGFWKRVRTAAAWWSPYLALMILFVVWRALLHPFAGYSMRTVNGMQSSPLATLWNLALTIVQDLTVAGFTAWGQPLQNLSGLMENGSIYGLRLLAVILFTGLIAFLYFTRLRSRPSNDILYDADCEPNWGLQAVITGLIAALASGWPTWITGLPMRMGFPQDRYSLAMSVGISLMLAGLIDILVKDLPRKTALLGLAVALAAGFHFNTSARYDQDWSTARDFFWQLSWRAPSVKANTLFASIDMPFVYYEDDSLTAPINWTYDPNGSSRQMPYILYDLDVRGKSLSTTKTAEPITHDFRATDFSGSSSQVLLFYYEPPGCLHILNPDYDTETYRLPDRLLHLMPLSNPKALVENAEQSAAPPDEIFGSEPKHRWCYFYQKAELARQAEDWEAIYKLSKQSIKKGFRPEDPEEYLPFIEGYARHYMWDDAIQLSIETEQNAPSTKPAICAIWKRTYAENPNIPEKYRSRLNKRFHCSIP